MHLVGPYMTTTSYKKCKHRKLTDAQYKQLEQDWRSHNKRMRKMNCHSAQFDTLDDYVAYTRGEYRSEQKQVSVETYKPIKSYQRETPHIPSAGDGIGGWAPKKESQKYTGTLIKGIATMHKSNAVPIINKEQAIEVSNMRRG
jgi:hypothetical protein